jgi:hypothetical protein
MSHKHAAMSHKQVGHRAYVGGHMWVALIVGHPLLAGIHS